MSQVLDRLTVGWVVALLLATAAHADGKLEGALKVEQSVQANLLPFAPAYVTPKCLVPYPLCKFVYAGISMVAGWEQLILGGDLKGAESSMQRGMSGPWLVKPENVTGHPLWSAPPPVPLVGYLATGRSNTGAVALDPLPSAKQKETEGDILPP
jgi:hypothetical protein